MINIGGTETITILELARLLQVEAGLPADPCFVVHCTVTWLCGPKSILSGETVPKASLKTKKKNSKGLRK